jgi:hypothetical protein
VPAGFRFGTSSFETVTTRLPQISIPVFEGRLFKVTFVIDDTDVASAITTAAGALKQR